MTHQHDKYPLDTALSIANKQGMGASFKYIQERQPRKGRTFHSWKLWVNTMLNR